MRLIDADALYEEIHDLMYTKESPSVILTESGQEIFNSGVGSACCLVAQASTIDAVPVVHAKWTGGKYYNGTYGYEKTCTNCKKEYVVVYGYLFCPYCGARMDGEKDDGS